jgi:hypothetical protein
MTIILNDTEFSEAIVCYLNSKGLSAEEYKADVQIINGRSGNGTRAEVELTPLFMAEVQPPKNTTTETVDNTAPFEEDEAESDETVEEKKPAFGKLSFGDS